MQGKHFTVILLVVLAMAAGFAARQHISQSDPYDQLLKNRSVSRQLSAYAPRDTPSDAGGRSDVDLRPLNTFYSALQLLREEYVEPIKKPQEKDLAYGSVSLMLDSLHDPLTRFYDVPQAKLIDARQSGKFDGIGAVFTVKQVKADGGTQEYLRVVTVLPGSPARKAGIRSGDTITEINGKSVLPYNPLQRVEKLITGARNGTVDRDKLPKIFEAEQTRIENGLGFQKAADMLAANSDKDLTLTVSRAGVKNPLKITVGTATITVDPVSVSTMGSKVGYVHISLLNKNAESELTSALAGFKKSGIKFLVVDLRDSAGGDIDSARAVSGSLVGHKPISILQLAKNRKSILDATPASSGAAWSGPVAVLVDGTTAGVSEVLAAAIHDDVAGKLVGERTAGNNMQATLMPLKNGSAVTMTTGKYLTPKGVDYRNKGLVPDVIVHPSGKSGDDVQLAKAVQILTSGKGRG